MATPTWQTINATQDTESVDFTVNELTEIEIDTGIENAPTLSCLVRAVNSEEAQTTLILFAAGGLKGKPITPTRYEYWSHASKIPNCNIIFVSDPALKTPGTRGITVGLHKDFDGIEVIYSGIKKS